jgi:hypothetical protein
MPLLVFDALSRHMILLIIVSLHERAHVCQTPTWWCNHLYMKADGTMFICLTILLHKERKPFCFASDKLYLTVYHAPSQQRCFKPMIWITQTRHTYQRNNWNVLLLCREHISVSLGMSFNSFPNLWRVAYNHSFLQQTHFRFMQQPTCSFVIRVRRDTFNRSIVRYIYIIPDPLGIAYFYVCR